MFKTRRSLKGRTPAFESFNFLKKKNSFFKWQDLRIIARNYLGEGNAIGGGGMRDELAKGGQNGTPGSQTVLLQRGPQVMDVSGFSLWPHCDRTLGTYFPFP